MYLSAYNIQEKTVLSIPGSIAYIISIIIMLILLVILIYRVIKKYNTKKITINIVMVIICLIATWFIPITIEKHTHIEPAFRLVYVYRSKYINIYGKTIWKNEIRGYEYNSKYLKN